MASTVVVLVLLSACLFTDTVGFDEHCNSYFTSSNEYKPFESCSALQHCCGTCDHRYCCSSGLKMLSKHDQNMCTVRNDIGVIVSVIVGLVILIIMFIVCCCCPCCCIYKMCRKPRPVVGTHITTVMNTQCIQQQPVMQGAQYPVYQPVPTQPGYGGQPMQTGPYQGQPYAPGPLPPYHTVVSPGYPSGQAAYDGSQAMQLSAQPGTTHLPSEAFSQPAYNPAYMQPPKTDY